MSKNTKVPKFKLNAFWQNQVEQGRLQTLHSMRSAFLLDPGFTGEQSDICIVPVDLVKINTYSASRVKLIPSQ